MLAFAIGAAIAAAPAALFIAIAPGIRQAYPIDLALQGRTLLAAFARRVPDVYLGMGLAQRQAALDADWAGAGL